MFFHKKGNTPFLFAKKQNNAQNLENIRENATLRNGKMQNLSNAEITESKADSESKSKAENLGNTQLAESSPTDSKENLDSKIHYFRFKFRI